MSSAPLRGAIIGYGFISGKGHAPAYQSRIKEKGDVRIEAIADICPARLEVARQAWPEARLYDSGEKLIEAERDRIDFVDVSTPPCDHYSLSRAALEAGLHVLCEKPLTTTAADAATLLRIARERRRVLFPCHNYKHAPVVKAIGSLIESGRIGRVRSVTLSTFRNTHARGVLEWRTDWRREHRYSGGGIAMDHGSHSFYLTFEWLASYPTALSAKLSTLDSRWDTEDNFSTVVTFPTGEAHLYLSWTAGVRKVIYTIQGTNGAITVDDDDMQIDEMYPCEDGPNGFSWKKERVNIASHWMDASHVSWFNSLFDQYRAAIAAGDFAGKEAEEAWRCVSLIETAYRSASERCRELELPASPWK